MTNMSSDHFPEFDMLDKPLPKGILKNSNPNATYHKHHHRRKLEELVENGAEIIPTTHNHHGRHRHHHKHHRHHSDESDQEKNEKNRKHHSSSSSKKKHHKHHHRHHRNDQDAPNDNFATSDIVEENEHNTHRSSSSSTSSSTSERRNGTSDRKHRHQQSKHHRQTDNESIEMGTNQGVSAIEEPDNIYDCPKVPPVPVVVLMNANDNNKTTTDYQNSNTEALQKQKEHASPNLNNSASEVVYDVPRSNPRKVEKPKEAIYVNETYSEKLQNFSKESTKINNATSTPDGTYDVPRTVNEHQQQQPQHLEDLIPVAYDVPKIRDSLSTIEEEHQEYDVPRNVNHALKAKFDHDDDSNDDPLVNNSEENLYENQAYQDSIKKEDNIYVNDSVAHATLSELSVASSTHTDDSRSSGYRSSSSPSIQSEELYVNESAIGSMEESSNSSPDIMSTLPHLKEIGVGTTESLPKDKKKSKKDKKEKEAKRDKERAQAEAVEREIISKKSLERPKSKAPKPPKTYFTDGSKNNAKIELPTVNTEERKKKLFESLEKKEPFDEKIVTNKKKEETKKKNEEPEKEAKPAKSASKKDSETKASKKQAEKEVIKEAKTTTFKEPIIDQGTLDKKPSQKDRSVDVYHETVRQRATRNSEAIKEVFAEVQEENVTLKKPSRKKSRAPQNPQKDINDEDLPSVKELRSKFEKEKSGSKIIEAIQDSPTPKKSPFKPSKIDFKKGFNVMSSLTRRSAMSVSKSMQNLNLDNQQSSPTIVNKKSDMEFGHFTYSDTEAQNTKNSSINDKKNKNSKSFSNKELDTPKEEKECAEEEINDKSPDPVYVNIESTRKQKQQPEKENNDNPIQQPIQIQHRARNGGESSAANKLLQSLENDEEEDNLTGLGPWNPLKIVAHLYKLEEIKPLSKGENSGKQGEELEGYIERLPPGKKKSTIWNSWKRQYFVAKAGLLLIFGDSSRSVLMDRIELFGGRVDYMESTMLGIQDRRGHYVVLRFKDNEDADKWHTGLSNHVSHDLAQTYVTPVANSNPDLFKHILIIDFGGSSVRAGIASSMPTLPQLFFPSVMAIGKSHEDEKYFGMDAFAPEIRSRCNLVHPFAPSSNVDKYTVNQIALQGFLEKIFRDLNIDPSEYDVQLVSPRPLNEKTQKQLASLLFDDFGVRALNISHQSVLAMYAYNAHTGVVVDLGERMDVVPIVDGYRVSAGVSRSPVGGPQMRQKLQHYLLGRNYSLTTFVDSYVIRSAIENLSYMSRNFDRELDRYRKKPEKIDCILELGKNSKLEMGSERFEAVEGLFKPELWGLDQAGVHVLIHKAIRECSMDVRKEITQSIFLAGGLAMIPGLRERLELELEKLSPATKPRVHASPYRYHASYLGASVHATSAAFKQSKLTRDEWIGSGQRLAQPWNLS